MEVTSGEEEGFVREWTPCTHMLSLIPARVQNGLFSNALYLTCIDAVSDFIALGTNIGLVYWYDRKKGNIQRLRCEVSAPAITFVKIVNTVDYMVGAGSADGQVTVFQIPKQHPENVPDTFKPKVEPQVERYTISELHKGPITSIEWSKNGMKLFSGDKNGVICMTEIDFYMHLCKSTEIVNEEHEIVQMSYHQNSLLVSSVYRSIMCEVRDGVWTVNQVGKKERKSLCRLGATFQHSYRRDVCAGPGAAAYCARRGLRLWRADQRGEVHQTLLFKEAISNPLTIAELLNPSQKKHSQTDKEYNFGPLHIYREHFIVTHNEDLLYILDPRSLTAVAVVDDLRRILSVSVNKEEIFILEGPRSVVRLGHVPEPGVTLADDPVNLMTKSLTTSIQQAVNTVRDLTHLDQTVPYIASQAISIFTKGDADDNTQVASAEECFELPPVKVLPPDIAENVLESIVNEFKEVSEIEEIRKAKSEELEKKLKMYNSIMQKSCDSELIHSSRRRKENGSGANTPRLSTPVKKRADKKDDSAVSYTSPCRMSMSVYSDMCQDDKILEQQIEEKEKILAKMLNLESLSIKIPNNNIVEIEPKKHINPLPSYANKLENHTSYISETLIKQTPEPKAVIPKPVKANPIDLIPKLAKIPNNWNLEDIELKIDGQTNGIKDDRIISPDDTESEWELV